MNAPSTAALPFESLRQAASARVIAYRLALAIGLCRENLHTAASVARDPAGADALESPPRGAVPKVNRDSDAAQLLELATSEPQHIGRVLLHVATSLHYLYMAELFLDQLGGVSHAENHQSELRDATPQQLHVHLARQVESAWQRCNSIIDEAEHESARALELVQACAGACTDAPEMAQGLKKACEASQAALSLIHRIAASLEAYAEAMHDLDMHVKG